MRSRSRGGVRSASTAVIAGFALSLTACRTARLPAPLSPAVGSRPAALIQLQRDIDALVAAPALEHSYWGVLVMSLKTDDQLYSWNAHRLLMPASTMKIVTMAAAAERLGWDYTFETRLMAAGPIDGGVLDGDLVVVGSGDPSIIASAGLFAEWADRLKAAGIRTISGRLVGNDNRFDDEGLGFGWSWDDLAEGYSASIGALQYNENTVDATITPGPQPGAPATVVLTPAGSGIVLENRIQTAPAGTTATIGVRRRPGTTKLELRGSVPLGFTAPPRVVSVENPTLFFVTALRDALMAKGIEVRGPAVDIDDLTDAPTATSAAPVITYRSPPLSELGSTLMKESQNLYAETLLKTLDASPSGAAIEGGRAATKSVLQQWGIPPTELIQMDGSGLSRYDYLTANLLTGILAHIARNDKLRGPLEATLPIAGRDGTLAGRMKNTPAEGNARAKTGSMTNVRALAGYVTTADGEPLVFAILANNFDAPATPVTQTIDAIVVRLATFRR